MTTSNPEVKRYNITIDKYRQPVPYETEHGRWVEYSSYKALQAECEELRKDVERYKEALAIIDRQVDGNIRDCVRDCVNGLPFVQDIYGYCDAIDAAIDTAMQTDTPC